LADGAEVPAPLIEFARAVAPQATDLEIRRAGRALDVAFPA
jgi:hypothetical protein